MERRERMRAAVQSGWRVAFRSPSSALRSGMVASAVLAVLLVIAFRACAPASSATQARIGQPAVAFTLAAEQAGKSLASPVTFAPTAGKPTLLVFFYTLCTHCLLQMQAVHAVTSDFPALRELYIDSPAELPNLPDLMMKRLAIADPVLLDADGTVAARYGIAYYPAMVLVDGHGSVRAIWTGEVSTTTVRDGIAQVLNTAGNG